MDSAKVSTQHVERQLPEWEHVAVGRVGEKRDTTSTPRTSVKRAFVDKLDSVLPQIGRAHV